MLGERGCMCENLGAGHLQQNKYRVSLVPKYFIYKSKKCSRTVSKLEVHASHYTPDLSA